MGRRFALRRAQPLQLARDLKTLTVQKRRLGISIEGFFFAWPRAFSSGA